MYAKRQPLAGPITQNPKPFLSEIGFGFYEPYACLLYTSKLTLRAAATSSCGTCASLAERLCHRKELSRFSVTMSFL